MPSRRSCSRLSSGCSLATRTPGSSCRSRAGPSWKRRSRPGCRATAGPAVVMTSLTTAAGLASFVTAELAPIAHLGVIAPIGVMIALAYSVTLLPALVAVWPLGAVSAAARRGSDLRGGRLERLLTGIGDAACRRPVAVLVGTALLALLCSGGLL